MDKLLLEELDYELYEMEKFADHNIPFYAYGDNEAACELASRLKRIEESIEILRNIFGLDKKQN